MHRQIAVYFRSKAVNRLYQETNPTRTSERDLKKMLYVEWHIYSRECYQYKENMNSIT